jgi:gliding motility-associated lipoprotein GldD
MNKTFYILLLVVLAIFSSCKEENYTPKPYGYQRFTFKAKTYQKLDNNYPYNFDYPTYTTIEKDKAYDTQPYWINIVFPQLNGKIHLSYKNVNNNFSKLSEDAHKLAYKHAQMADAIKEKQFTNNQKDVYGLIYLIKGNTASPIQFFVTDSTKNFLRGSLYFNTHPNKDSLNPVIGYVYKDIIRLMESLEWRQN